MGMLKSIEVEFKQRWTDIFWQIGMARASIAEPNAVEFYRKINEEMHFPDHLIRVAPSARAIYVMVPKVASTRIRRTLGEIEGRYSRRLKPTQWGRLREAQGLRSMSVQSFYRLATDANTFRFAFVRNPYSRILGYWASIKNQAQEKAELSRPEKIEDLVSFDKFTALVAENYQSQLDQHLLPQDALTSVPGMKLDFIGRIESFQKDFSFILDRLGASEKVRRDAMTPVNMSGHGNWLSYYTQAIADRVYRMYECDFDCFKYPRSLQTN